MFQSECSLNIIIESELSWYVNETTTCFVNGGD